LSYAFAVDCETKVVLELESL